MCEILVNIAFSFKSPPIETNILRIFDLIFPFLKYFKPIEIQLIIFRVMGFICLLVSNFKKNLYCKINYFILKFQSCSPYKLCETIRPFIPIIMFSSQQCKTMLRPTHMLDIDFFFSNPQEAGSEQGIFPFSLVYVCVCVYIFVTPLDQTKNDKDLKFATNTPIDHI